nr:chloroplast envelope membrane protein [Chlorosarcina stigmatica]
MNNSTILNFFKNIYNQTAGLDKFNKAAKLQTVSFESQSLVQPKSVPTLASQISAESKFKANKPVSITYEEIGLFPRSFVRVFDRFLKQLFSDVEGLVIEEYRFYRYIILTAFKTMFILLVVPLLVNLCSKNYIIRPLTEYFWNTQNTEIFLNASQQKRAFAELQEFEEQLYFDSLVASLKKEHLHYNDNHKILHESANAQLLETPKVAKLQEVQRSKNSPQLLDLIFTENVNSKDTHNTLNNLSSDNTLLNDSINQFSTTISVEAAKLQELYGLSPSKDKFDTVMPVPTTVNDLHEINQEQTKNAIFQSKFSYHGSANASKSEALALPWHLEQNPYTKKAKELAMHYNHQSIEAITNFLGDFLGFLTLCYLIITMKIQINITKAFLTEFFFGLEDSKKSLIILLVTDLLVGYHSPHLWELFFEFLLDYYGFPQTETGIELLVATIPPVLDVLFKYLIFRHLNRSSPATVATYHAMIE